MSELPRLQELAGTQDEVLSERAEHELAAGRARFLAHESPRHVWRARATALALAAAALLGVLRWTAVAPRPLSYTVDSHPASPGQWLSSASDPSTLRFDDGSTIALSPASDARVAEVRADGADVVLSRGAMAADITHTGHASWTMEAGPFSVHVVGTAFDLGWDPDTAHLELAMREGEVRVEGPLLGTRSLRSDESLAVWLREGRVEERRQTGHTVAPAAPPPPTTEPDQPIEPPTPPAELATAPRPDDETAETFAPPGTTPPGTTPPGSPEADAREVPAPRDDMPVDPTGAERPPGAAAQSSPAIEIDRYTHVANHRAAVAVAQEHGWDHTLRLLDAETLARLANSARLTGDIPLAWSAYQALRERFPGPHGTRAAFSLGRLAMDRRHDPESAADHFATYLREAPTGTFARDAAGRLIEARREAGQLGAAREAARRYLERYPSGPHAEYAEETLTPAP